MAQLPAGRQHITTAAVGYIPAGAEAVEESGLGSHMANGAGVLPMDLYRPDAHQPAAGS